MKVLHVIQYFTSSYGGPSAVCKDTCKYLAERGHEVVICTTDLDYPSGKLDVPVNRMLEQDGYKICYFSATHGYGLSVQLCEYLLNSIHSFDIVEIHGLYRFPQAITAYISRFKKVPYIVRPHGALDPFLHNQSKHYWLKRIYESLVEFPNINSASAIQYTAEEEYRLTRSFNFKPPHFILPLGLDLDQYSKLPKSGEFRKKLGINNEKIILYLGRINFKKGLDILIEATRTIVSSESIKVKLVIVGPDNEGYKSKLIQLTNKLGLQDRVVFTGMLVGQEKLAALIDSDVFVLSSHTENFGVTIIEAMFCMLPVVMSNKVNIWREIQHSGSALITSCESGDVADAISKILDNPKMSQQMGICGRSAVEHTYNWDAIIPKLIDMYEKFSRKKRILYAASAKSS